jgi:hypothetical protein
MARTDGFHNLLEVGAIALLLGTTLKQTQWHMRCLSLLHAIQQSRCANSTFD